MNEKYSLQYIIDSLSQATGESKKVAEQFSKAFFDTIVEALYLGESSIRIKGLGTFKLVEVDSRESVNVSNGERIVIPSYKKVSFVPDDEITDRLTRLKAATEKEEEDEPAEVAEPVITTDATDTLEVPEVPAVPEPEEAVPVNDSIDELIAPAALARVEEPCNSLGGIDLLISTPESIKDIREQYEEAKLKAEQAIAVAKQANTEKVRLEKMLARLVANAEPESVEAVDSNEQPLDNIVQPEQNEPVATPEPSIMPEPPVAPIVPPVKDAPVSDDVADDLDDDDDDDEPWIVRNKRKLALLSVVLFCGILFCVNLIHKADMQVLEAEVVDEPEVERRDTASIAEARAKRQKEIADSIKNVERINDSIAVAKAKSDSIAAAEKQAAAEQERKIPPYCFLKKGESLTIISMRYYGTKDSVPPIIRLNRFKNPDKVPAGAKVFLP